MSVADKVVLITGAARGLGFAYARSLGAARQPARLGMARSASPWT